MGEQVKGREGALTVKRRVFWLPKSDHREEEYEDAFALTEGAALPFYAAVADGATESVFAQRWAEQLAKGFVQEKLSGPEALAARLPAWQADWVAAVDSHADALPWYAAEKAEQGAFAAFLGLTLQPGGAWQAVAVGDCCLFHLRGDAVNRQWPVEAREQFGHRPALLPSRAEQTLPEIQRCEGICRPGDALLLATDAVAAWLMHTGPHAALSFDEAIFREAVAQARAAGALRNDDATLLVLEMAAPE